MLLTADEAAERLGVTPRYIRTLTRTGRLRHYVVGRKLRVDTADLDDFLRASLHEAAR